MDSKNSIINKAYYVLFYVALGLLAAYGILVAINSQAIVFALLIPGIFFVGYSVRKNIKINEALFAIGLVVGLITLISMIVTWVNYGLFHTLIYKDTPIYYINAVPYDVTKEVMFLYNFKFQEVSVEYAGIYGLIAASFLPGLMFVSPKENKLRFYLTLGIGVTGFLALITVPNFKALIVLALVSAFALVYRLYWKNIKVANVIKYVIWGLFVLAILFYIITGINVMAGYPFSGFLDKLFHTNPIMRNVCALIEVGKTSGNIIGFTFVKEASFSDWIIESGIFEVELLREVGTLGVTFVMLFISISFISVNRFLSYEEHPDFSKVVSLTFLLSVFIYSSLFYDSFPLVLKDYEESYLPVFRFTPFLLAIFLLGITYFAPNKAKEEVK